MASFFRHMVSMSKRRYQEDGFDLDLSYITDRIIAMGYPSQNAEAMYRNPVPEVVRFFETKHRGHYKIYNLCSERCYDPALFGNAVANYPFEDHNCPPIGLIPNFCASAESWLREDPKNVVAVHCKAGKSRTGLMICCLLLHIGACATATEARLMYNEKRTTDGHGLNIGSQVRYVSYYERIISNQGVVPPPRYYFLMVLHFENVPPTLKRFHTLVRSHDGVLFNSQTDPCSMTPVRTDDGCDFVVMLNLGALLVGDFKLELWKDGKKRVFYTWHNTSFITDPHVVIERDGLDKFKDKEGFPDNFRVHMKLVEDDVGRGAGRVAGAGTDGHPAVRPERTDIELYESDGSDEDEEEGINEEQREMLRLAMEAEKGAPSEALRHEGERREGGAGGETERPETNEVTVQPQPSRPDGDGAATTTIDQNE